jgi:hypothetical protein
MTAGLVLGAAVLSLAACGGSGSPGGTRASVAARVAPSVIVPAPKDLLAAAQPQANGVMWALAGQSSVGLYGLQAASGRPAGSAPVSADARSLAESTTGIIGLATGTPDSGALELLDARTTKLRQSVALPAPARQVAVGGDGTTFYVLTAWSASASVSVVDSRNGRITRTVPVPADTVSIAPDTGSGRLYVLERSGLVDQVSISGGQLTARFAVGNGEASDAGRSIALSPDGSTLYVLKGTAEVSNVAVVATSTQSVTRVLPAPRDCVQLLVAATGRQLYEMVGAAGYGNIQVFGV